MPTSPMPQQKKWKVNKITFFCDCYGHVFLSRKCVSHSHYAISFYTSSGWCLSILINDVMLHDINWYISTSHMPQRRFFWLRPFSSICPWNMLSKMLRTSGVTVASDSVFFAFFTFSPPRAWRLAIPLLITTTLSARPASFSLVTQCWLGNRKGICPN